MTEKELFYQNITNLYAAIKENDLNSTKIIVDWLNEHCDINNVELYNLLNNFNPLALLDTYNNESLDYILDNLNNLLNSTFIKWNKLINEAQKNENKFIELSNMFLDNNNLIELYCNKIGFLNVKTSLIKLCYIWQNFTLLEQIQNKIKD